MSLTEADGLFIGVHEDGLTDLLAAVLFPRRLNYRSGIFVGMPASPTSPNDWTVLNLAGLTYALQFTPPVMNIDPFPVALLVALAGGLPVGLVPSAGQIIFQTHC